MKIVWITHHLPGEESNPAWLNGNFRGGAEMSDAEYIAGCPVGISIEVIPSPIVEQYKDTINDADRVVITGTDLLSDEAMLFLATLKPMVFVHHRQARSLERRVLLENAFPFVCHTPAHLALESEWCDFANKPKLVLSAFDAFEIKPSAKEPFAFAAARNHPLKGLDRARLHAEQNGMEFIVATDWSRADVLKTMSRAQWFIHLPFEFESECRSVMEAILAGCEVITNDNVGITSFPMWRDRAWLRDEIIGAQLKFWNAVLQ